ncbi:MAG: hypothetical protein GY862_22535 [Gammaproteobacteria bacterium]|nr:hypothetical protein [Gammaproteobacteria bacterium]
MSANSNALKFFMTMDAGEFRAGLRGSGQDVKKFGDDTRRAGKDAGKLSGDLDRVNPAARAAGAGLKALAASAAGLLTIGALVKKISDGMAASAESERAMLRFEQLVRQTGGAAGFTADELDRLARNEALATLGDTKGARSAISVMLTFKKVAGETFERSIALASDMGEVLGSGMAGAATMLGKALEDPIAGLNAMRRVGVSFSAEERKMIATLMDANDLIGAQNVILSALEGQMGGASRAAAQGFAGSLDTLGQRWDEFWESIGKVVTNAPKVKDGFDGFSDSMKGFTENLNENQELYSKALSGALQNMQDDFTSLLSFIPGLEGYSDAVKSMSNAEKQLTTTQDRSAQQLKALSAQLGIGISDMDKFNRLVMDGVVAFDQVSGKWAMATEGAGAYQYKIRKLESGMAESQKRLKMLENDSAEHAEELARRTADRKLSEHERVLASARRSLDDAMQAEENYAQQIAGLRQQLINETMSDEDRIRQLRQKTMGESARQADIELQIQEKLKAAREAVEAGDTDKGKKLANNAKQLAGGLKRAESAISLFEEAAAASREATEAELAAVEDTHRKIQDITANKDEKLKIKADIAQASSAIDSLKTQLAGIQDKTVTVTLKQVEAHAVGGWAGFRGQLPGYGGGDKVRALLEAGEFVVNKERSRLFANEIYTMNYGSLSDVYKLFGGVQKLQPGGPVLRYPVIPNIQRFQGGPATPASADAGSVETVRLVFDTGRSKGEILAKPAADARRLADGLRELSRGMR